jgi:hypothetical protein
MVSCFDGAKKVIFGPKKSLKKGTTVLLFCSKNLERFRTPTHIKIFSHGML